MQTVARPVTPIARLLSSVPALPLLVVSWTARLAGSAAAISYAYDLDTLFPERHLPRTWVLAVVITSAAVLSIAPLVRMRIPRPVASWFSALGCGGLVFGGAMFAHKPAGVAVFIAGVVAWLAFALATSARGEGRWAPAVGLMSGAGLAFGTFVVALLVAPA